MPVGVCQLLAVGHDVVDQQRQVQSGLAEMVGHAQRLRVRRRASGRGRTRGAYKYNENLQRACVGGFTRAPTDTERELQLTAVGPQPTAVGL